jgi:phthalate 4,5-dioxygenase reductase subunit
MSLRVIRKACIAQDVHQFELAASDGAALPPFEAGAHVTVITPNGLTRRYSLCNAPGENTAYRIAVKREPQGLGGSASMVDQVKEGDMLPTSLPLNYFPLAAGASPCLLIAGGIGITPILAMARALQARRADFRLVYLTRQPASAAFLAELQAPDLNGHARVHHNEGDSSRRFDLAAAIAGCAPDAQLYCCGPRHLMQSVREMTTSWAKERVHFEDFGTSQQPPDVEDHPFQVKLARSGRTLDVPCGVSILETLRRAGVVVPSSCESGTCGSCRTGLLGGVAEHRDYVLDDDQHDEIMICVSRARGSILEIDL